MEETKDEGGGGPSSEEEDQDDPHANWAGRGRFGMGGEEPPCSPGKERRKTGNEDLYADDFYPKGAGPKVE